MNVLTVGVEEEFHILSRQTGRLASEAAAVLSCDNTAKNQGDIKGEMPLSQLEITTPVCISITELHKSLSQLRLTASEMARKAGCYLVASGTPFSGDATGQAFAEEELVTALVGYCPCYIGYTYRELVKCRCIASD